MPTGRLLIFQSVDHFLIFCGSVVVQYVLDPSTMNAKVHRKRFRKTCRMQFQKAPFQAIPMDSHRFPWIPMDSSAIPMDSPPGMHLVSPERPTMGRQRCMMPGLPGHADVLIFGPSGRQWAHIPWGTWLTNWSFQLKGTCGERMEHVQTNIEDMERYWQV